MVYCLVRGNSNDTSSTLLVKLVIARDGAVCTGQYTIYIYHIRYMLATVVAGYYFLYYNVFFTSEFTTTIVYYFFTTPSVS